MDEVINILRKGEDNQGHKVVDKFAEITYCQVHCRVSDCLTLVYQG